LEKDMSLFSLWFYGALIVFFAGVPAIWAGHKKLGLTFKNAEDHILFMFITCMLGLLAALVWPIVIPLGGMYLVFKEIFKDEEKA
jgi:hypothetical protein